MPDRAGIRALGRRGDGGHPSTVRAAVTLSPMSVVVTLDGELHDPETPLLFADDLAAVRGDGIFESLLVRDGGPCLLEAHLQRLAQSAEMMDLPTPDAAAWRR